MSQTEGSIEVMNHEDYLKSSNRCESFIELESYSFMRILENTT